MKHWYEIAKGNIIRKEFELNDFLDQLGSLRLAGKITEDQLNELTQMARENADPAASLHLQARLEDIENRLRKLENGSAAPAPVEDWPAWQVHKVYKTGDHITYTDGRHYTCQLPENVASTTWSPADYPAYWQAEV